MIIKSADDKRKRLALLADLKNSPMLDAYQRNWLNDELIRTHRGIEGERDAAHCIDNYLKDSKNHAVIHDLRIEVDGEVAQIDHLMLNRLMFVFLFETKCFNGNLDINDRGEFSVQYGNDKCFGIPSPMEQSKRHERVISKLLDQLGITGRLGMKPTFVHAVLLHPKAIISRPNAKVYNTNNVIKADQIATWHQAWVEKDAGIGTVLTGFMNFRGADTLKEWADKICGQHQPTDQLNLPDFMKPKAVAPARLIEQPQASPPPMSAHDESLKRKLVCVACGTKITYPEGKFCWNNEKRFGGFQYCRDHQVQLSQ